MKTAELTGAQLDYYTALADGIPAENLQIRPIPRSIDFYCVRTVRLQRHGQDQSEARAIAAEAMNYSIDGRRGCQLIDKFRPHHMPAMDGRWWAAVSKSRFVQGDTALQAICRAIVLDKFGPEVDDVEVQP